MLVTPAKSDLVEKLISTSENHKNVARLEKQGRSCLTIFHH